MAHIPLLLTDAATREELVRNVSDPLVHRYWKTYTQLEPLMQQANTQFILSRLQKLLADPYIRHIVTQPKTMVNFAELLDTGSILLVKVSQKHWQLACVVCYTVLGQFVNAAYARRNAQEREEPERFRFYADGYTWNHFIGVSLR